MNRRWVVVGMILLLLLSSVFYILGQPSRVLWGTLTGEAFWGGFPTSYWEKQLTDEPGAKADARTRLEQAGVEAVPVLRELIRKNSDPEVRWTAIELIGKLGPAGHSASEELIVATNAPDSHVRGMAVKTIPQVETPASQGVPVLIGALDSEHAILAARALSVYRGDARPALTALVNILKDPARDAEVRWNAVRTLGKMGPDGLEALPVLIEYTKDPDDLVREHSAEAMGDIGPAAAEGIPALIECLDDPIVRVRRDAVRSLGQIGEASRSAVPLIKALLNDPEDLVRTAARKALMLIAPEEVPTESEPPADADGEVKRHAAPTA